MVLVRAVHVQHILMLVSLMFNRLGLNSKNSSQPPSSDPDRKRKSRGKGLKRGGQNGHQYWRQETLVALQLQQLVEVLLSPCQTG